MLLVLQAGAPVLPVLLVQQSGRRSMGCQPGAQQECWTCVGTTSILRSSTPACSGCTFHQTTSSLFAHFPPRAVAAANPGNPLLQMRGNAGSHDMGLGTDTLQALKAATRPGSSVPIPRCEGAAVGWWEG